MLKGNSVFSRGGTLKICGAVLAFGFAAQPAYAQGASGQSDLFGFLIPIVLMIGVFWFFLIRPQQKREKERQAMIVAIGLGDKIITNGGLHATVKKVIDQNSLEVEISKGTIVTLHRQMVYSVVVPKASAGRRAQSRKKAT